MFKNEITPNAALSKLMTYCSKMERCSYDVFQKLKEWNISSDDSNIIIQKLYQDNFINDERYLNSYIRGKFLYNKWGKSKIKFNLKNKGFDQNFLDTFFDEIISDNDYNKSIEEEIIKKNNTIKETDKYKRKSKLLRFALSRGYNTDIAIKVIDSLNL